MVLLIIQDYRKLMGIDCNFLSKYITFAMVLARGRLNEQEAPYTAFDSLSEAVFPQCQSALPDRR